MTCSWPSHNTYDEGDLPPDCDPAALTHLVVALMDGIAVQADSGWKEDLCAIAGLP
ncbi:hypothetical protein [Actinomadura sp. 9N215]|uniref:hypothetical protein n=1 Tax=Actinomadura sp. 9N215 TaxID=3375150 RepID=UPI00378DCF8F